MSQPRSLVDPVADRIIHIDQTLEVQPARAFEYFTNSELLTAWLSVAAKVETNIGGKYELFWEPNDPENNSTIGCRVTALKADQLLAFQWRSPKQFKSFTNGVDPLTHVVLLFVPEGSGTRIHLVHTGWRSSQAWEEARAWQQRAWSVAFETLEQVASH